MMDVIRFDHETNVMILKKKKRHLSYQSLRSVQAKSTKLFQSFMIVEFLPHS